jgi:hypothetical protein
MRCNMPLDVLSHSSTPALLIPEERKGFMPAMQGANLARGSTCPLCIRGPVYLGADSCFPEPACVVAYNTSHERSHGRILTLVSADVRLHSMCVPASTLHSWRAKIMPSTQDFPHSWSRRRVCGSVFNWKQALRSWSDTVSADVRAH